jgi:hypothetical protein
MSDIQDALKRIYRLEGDPTDTDPLPLSVTSPVAMSVKKVWPYFPPASQVITSTPCFVNTYSPRTVEYGSALSRLAYAVHARLVVYDANSDQAAKIASSFLEPIIERFEAHVKLSGLSEWMLNTLRFDNEQPVVFDDLSTAAGKTLIGLDFFIDITHNRRSVAAGGAPPSWA